jgi:hypothetical protein
VRGGWVGTDVGEVHGGEAEEGQGRRTGEPAQHRKQLRLVCSLGRVLVTHQARVSVVSCACACAGACVACGVAYLDPHDERERECDEGHEDERVPLGPDDAEQPRSHEAALLRVEVEQPRPEPQLVLPLRL